MFRKYTSVDRVLKNKIVTVVEPVFLSPLVDQITGFGKVSALTMLHYIFASYEEITKIELKEKSVKMMGTYDPTELLARLIKQSEKGITFARSGGQTISDAMMMS